MSLSALLAKLVRPTHLKAPFLELPDRGKEPITCFKPVSVILY